MRTTQAYAWSVSMDRPPSASASQYSAPFASLRRRTHATGRTHTQAQIRAPRTPADRSHPLSSCVCRPCAGVRQPPLLGIMYVMSSVSCHMWPSQDIQTHITQPTHACQILSSTSESHTHAQTHIHTQHIHTRAHTSQALSMPAECSKGPSARAAPGSRQGPHRSSTLSCDTHTLMQRQPARAKCVAAHSRQPADNAPMGASHASPTRRLSLCLVCLSACRLGTIPSTHQCPAKHHASHCSSLHAASMLAGRLSSRGSATLMYLVITCDMYLKRTDKHTLDLSRCPTSWPHSRPLLAKSKYVYVL